MATNALGVVVSAALLGTIVVGTFTAFDAANRSTTDEQERSQANDLAAAAQPILNLSRVTGRRAVALSQPTAGPLDRMAILGHGSGRVADATAVGERCEDELAPVARVVIRAQV